MSSLFGFEQQQKKISQNPFRIRIFLFLTYLFRIETINSSYTPVAPLKTIPDSRPKWAKSIPVFRLKRRKDPKYWISGPKRYLDFRETRHRPRYPEKQRAEHHGKNAKRALAKAGVFWAVRGQNKNCHTMLRSNSMLSAWCCLFCFKSELKSCSVCNYWFYKTFSFQACSNCS